MKFKDTDIIDYKLLGKRIKEKRVQKGKTQEQVGEMLEISNEYVSKLETGSVRISLRRLAEISLLLDVPIDFFITGIIKEAPEYKENELIKTLEDLSSKEKDVIYNVIKQIKTLRR